MSRRIEHIRGCGHPVRRLTQNSANRTQNVRSLQLNRIRILKKNQFIYVDTACRSFKYASPRLWNQLPDSFRQPHQSCLDSPPHPLVNPSLSSSHSHYQSLLHSFTRGSKPTFSTNHSHFSLLLPTAGCWTAFVIMGLDRTGPITLIILFLVTHFNFFCLFHVVD